MGARSVLLILVAIETSAYAGVFTCCTPKQWQATVRTLLQVIRGADSVTMTTKLQTVNYDATNARVSVLTFQEDDLPTYDHQILDYRTGARYVIHGQQQQTCVRYPLRGPFRETCVPDNTSDVAFAGIGGMAENTAYFSGRDYSGYVTVTLADCAFVAEVVYSEVEGGAVNYNVQYVNQTFYVDTSSFDVPSTCRIDMEEITEGPWQQIGIYV